MNTLLLRIAAMIVCALPARAAAQVLGNADEINVGDGNGPVDIKELIVRIIKRILDFMALIAVVTIIIAGIWLIVGLGEESSKERAKKIVIYTIVGLLLIMLARAIVTFIIDLGGASPTQIVVPNPPIP